MDEFKVMSIDFDYFQKIDDGDILRKCYPDGLDLKTELSTLVWAPYYENPQTKDLLQSVGIMEDEFGKIKELIKNQSKFTTFVATNSHVEIYSIINQLMDISDAKRLDVTNIDMHHDMVNGNKTLDCGNWISFLKKKYPNTSVHWISNPISKEMYGMTDVCYDMIDTSIGDDVLQKQYDLVFLARSDNWTPPHLDSRFNELLNVARNQEFFISKVAECVMSERDVTKNATIRSYRIVKKSKEKPN